MNSKLDHLLKKIATNRSLLVETADELFTPLRKIDHAQKYVKNQKVWLFAALPIVYMIFIKRKMKWATSLKSGNKLLIAWRLINYLKNVMKK